MLVLTRELGQSINIYVDGRRVRLTVSRVDGDGKVRLGFEAEKDVVILREEIDENYGPKGEGEK
jgi:carbon storage regulator CsrA